MLHLPFHRRHLLQSSHVPLAAVELRGEEHLDELPRDCGAEDLRAEAEHVHVVVLDTLVRAVEVVADRRADAGDLARRHRGADAGAADEDAALGVARADRLADLARLVRVVDAHARIVRAEVEDFVRVEGLHHRLAQRHPAVVERDGDARHATRSRSAVARATTLSTLKPRRSSTVVPGAEAPKRSRATESPWSPTHCFQPSATPGSTERRARTSGGSTSSR